MRLGKMLFSFEGRITRRQFWLGHLAIFCVSALFAVVAGFAVGIASVLLDMDWLRFYGPFIIGGLVSLCALVAETSLAVKRMHDRDGSAVWIMLLVGAVVILNLTITAQRFLYGERILDPLTVGLGTFAAIMGGWMIFELGFLSGTRGSNRYGDAPAQEEVAGLSDGNEAQTA